MSNLPENVGRLFNNAPLLTETTTMMFGSDDAKRQFEDLRQLEGGDPACPWLCDEFDHVGLAQRGRIGALIAELRAERWAEVRAALLTACGLEAV